MDQANRAQTEKGASTKLFLVVAFAVTTVFTVGGCAEYTGNPGSSDDSGTHKGGGKTQKAEKPAGAENKTTSVRLQARNDRVSTVEGRAVMVEMVANDEGNSLEVDEVKPGDAQGSIICEAEIESGKIQACKYEPVEGFTGKDKFEYTVKDASGKTDTAIVSVAVKPLVASGGVSKPLVAKDDRVKTETERPVMVEMVANDEGEGVFVEDIRSGPGKSQGVIGCNVERESDKLLACEYESVEGFTGTDRYYYTAKDADGNTDKAEVVIEVVPAD